MIRHLALALAFVLIAACGDTGGTTTTAVSSAVTAPPAEIAVQAYQDFRAQPTACGAEPPAPALDLRYDAPDDLGITDPLTAVIHTSCGPITLQLDPTIAPQTVNSFVFLAEQGYFDGTASHRIAPGFVIQMGDPTATGRGGPGYQIVDELPPAGFLYSRGTVAMANAGANTSGSQFFLVLEDAPLAPDFTVFGQVVGGLDVMDEIARLPLGPNPPDPQPSKPLQTLYIERVEITR